MSAGTTPTSTPRASGWIALLVLFGITSTIEAFTVAHVFRFLPLYLGTVHVTPAEVPAWTGYLNAAFFLFGLPLVPFWGVWSERYGRIPIIARSAFVEMVVFTVLWLAQNRWQAGFALLLVGFQLGNTGVMLKALRAVTPRGRVGFAISLFGVTPSLGLALGPAYFAQHIANPFLPLLVLRLVGSTSGAAGQIGIVFGASALLGALLSPLAGTAGDRFGFRPLLAGACVLAAASLAELALAPNLVWLTVGAVFLGAATATSISMVFAILATAVPEERRATTLNFVLLPIYLSSVAGAIVGALLVREGLNIVLWTGAAISLIAALLTTRLPSAERATAL